MINHHAALAVSLAEQLGLSDAVQEAVGCAYEQWDGQGWPGGRAGTDVPVAARLSGLADYVEVAYRMGGVDAARDVARSRQGKQFDPALSEVICDEGEMILSGLDDVGTWDAVIDAEPALAVAIDADQLRRGAAGDRELRRPEVALQPRPRRCGGRPGRRRRPAAGHVGRRGGHAAAGRAGARARPAGHLQRDLGQAGRARRRRVGAGAPAPLPDRAHAAAVAVAGAAGCDRRAAARAAGRLRLPARPVRHRRSRGRRGCWAPPTPTRRCASPAPTARRCRPTWPPPSCAPRSGRAGWTPTRWTPCWPPPATASPAAAAARPASRRARSRCCGCWRAASRTSRSRAQLVISPKTVGNHAEHIYAKIGATNRAGAGLFAMQHGLLPEERPAPESGAGKMGQTPHAGRVGRFLDWIQSSQRRARC